MIGKRDTFHTVKPASDTEIIPGLLERKLISGVVFPLILPTIRPNINREYQELTKILIKRFPELNIKGKRNQSHLTVWR